MPSFSTRWATSSISSRGSRMQFAGHLVDEQGNGHAPGALSRHAPIRTAGDHAADALLAPVGHPIHMRDGFERALAQARLLHADEPLRRRAKNDRRLVTPAVRIGMMVRLILEQAAVVVQHLDHMGVGVEHLLAGKQRGRWQESAVAAHRVVDFQSVAPADDVVIQAMPGRGMHGAGAGIEGDMLAQDHRNLPIVEGMLQQHVLESGAFRRRRSKLQSATPRDFMTASTNSLASTRRSSPLPKSNSISE